MTRTLTTFTGSGDALADRRLAFAEALADRGDWDGCLDLAEQAMALVPDWGAGWFALADWADRAGQRDRAQAAFARCLGLMPGDPLGAEARLALIGAAPTPAILPPAFVKGLFDAYADGFDTALTEKLGYRAPELLRAAVDRVAAPKVPGDAILDLGCGTGLSGAAFRGRASWLDGIDLSAGMLRRARAKKVYDGLTEGDMVALLTDWPRRYDVVLAADVLIYVGDLDPIVRAAAGVLGPDGLFAFTVQAGPAGSGYRLGPDRRFWHGREAVDAALAAAGLVPLSDEIVTGRRDGDRPVPCRVVVAGRGDRPVAAPPRRDAPSGDRPPA